MISHQCVLRVITVHDISMQLDVNGNTPVSAKLLLQAAALVLQTRTSPSGYLVASITGVNVDLALTGYTTLSRIAHQGADVKNVAGYISAELFR